MLAIRYGKVNDWAKRSPITFGRDALLNIAHILHRVLSELVSTMPYELWIGKKLAHLGTPSCVHATSQPHRKLDSKSKKLLLHKIYWRIKSLCDVWWMSWKGS